MSFARKQELRPSAVALPDLVIGMRELLKRSVETNISIDLRFPLDLPQAYVDANQLEMVLINLVVNARDAMPDGGSICIEGQSRTAAEAGRIDAPGYVILIVRDDGVGMEPEVLARATDPFFTTKGPGNGTGLGLSMAHGLAEQSGGRLQIHSRPGKGTTVEIWLPIATERQAEQTSDRVEPDPGPQLTASAELSLSVLVVDDDPLVLDNTASMLEDLGCQVTAVNSAETALGLLTQRVAYDILITDHMMPGMTGAQLADRLRNERPELPVLVVSGYADLADSPRQLQVLAKPFTQQTLLDAIQQSIGPSGKGAVVVDFHQKR
ncbi:ATP-binding protein [Stutzerimonas stutzeri]|uniref:ATP-binding protein n=1 Tax=Stutzerimonas stutzeri TaxID=316 RepID=UPI001E40AF20|nr:ATP-binding protein [Stutzerimonas stutzeri]